MSTLDEMPLFDESQVRQAWSMIHRCPGIFFAPEPVDEEAVARAKARIQAAAVEFGMGLLPEPGATPRRELP